MGDDVETIDCCNASPFAVGKSQAPTDRLFNQDTGVGSAEGDDGVEICNVPAFFEHVDVDDDFGGFVGAFHFE